METINKTIKSRLRLHTNRIQFFGHWHPKISDVFFAPFGGCNNIIFSIILHLCRPSGKEFSAIMDFMGEPKIFLFTFIRFREDADHESDAYFLLPYQLITFFYHFITNLFFLFKQ